MKLTLRYIATPYFQNQRWGVFNPEVYLRFGFTNHNGEDVKLGIDALVCAPVKIKIVQIGNHPKGAGIFVSGITIDAFDEWLASGPKAYKVYFTFMHLKEVLCKVGDVLDIGDLIAVGDNTGFSTGQHTHMFAGRVAEENGSYKFVDESLKHADYSFDHTKYYNGEYAAGYKAKKIIAETEAEIEEVKKLEALKYKEELEQKKLGILAQILELIKKLMAIRSKNIDSQYMKNKFGALQPIFGSSKNPENLSLTVKGILLAFVPVVIGIGQSQGWTVTEGNLVEFINLAFLGISSLVTAWGIIRKFKKTD